MTQSPDLPSSPLPQQCTSRSCVSIGVYRNRESAVDLLAALVGGRRPTAVFALPYCPVERGSLRGYVVENIAFCDMARCCIVDDGFGHVLSAGEIVGLVDYASGLIRLDEARFERIDDKAVFSWGYLPV